MAILDWKLKKEIVRIAFGQMRQNDVPDLVMDANNFDESRYGFAWSSLLEMYGHRFDKDRINVGPNSKYRQFFYELSEQLGCDEVVPGTTIIEANATEFVRVLPVGTKEKLVAALNQGGVQFEFREALEKIIQDINEPVSREISNVKAPELNLFPNFGKSWYPIYYTPSESLPTIQEGLASGHIDQSLYYQNTDAVNRWYSITNDEFYTGFDQCKTGLLKLNRHPEWQQFVGSDNCDGVVMLAGGGAHSKDAVLIKYLLEAAKSNGENKNSSNIQYQYTLIDRSSAMLELSRTKLEELLEKKDGDDYIEVKALRRDVMAMNGSEPVRSSGNLAWFITGGTLGNLDEESFFNSVKRVSFENDLLVVGVGCFSDTDDLDLDMLAKEYERDVVKDLVAVPLSAVWASLSIEESLEEALSSIKVEALADKHSDVPGAITVIASLPSKTLGDIILFKSSRYNEKQLIQFAKQKGWQHTVSIDGLDNSFKQIVFKRTAD
ncbi:MAG: L-histidine N(alpha)-methyltransferase [Kangiellaceae bacterium]|nr:L-histidine N(alpha)-methyltransferase [Kangiellaceae bacterium]MCW8997602.1 L-histidine N(alpha)-methyltransferase [Kangiellaceae bacterium]